jgi:hypothetical protein
VSARPIYLNQSEHSYFQVGRRQIHSALTSKHKIRFIRRAMDAASGSRYKAPPGANADEVDKQSDKSGEQPDPEESCADGESVGEGEGDSDDNSYDEEADEGDDEGCACKISFKRRGRRQWSELALSDRTSMREKP